MGCQTSVQSVVFFLVSMLSFLVPIKDSYGQHGVSEKYYWLIEKADSLYSRGEFHAAALSYSSAFQSNAWKGYEQHRYQAACAWALAGRSDSAFHNLFIIANKLHFSNVHQLISDNSLLSLREDIRWNNLITIVQSNDSLKRNLNIPLMVTLDSIRINDQHLRKILTQTEKEHAVVIDSLWKLIEERDSVNLARIDGIIEQYGWVGSDVVGEQGAYTLFIVILHADLETQEKYLPMALDAVSKGKASAKGLAYLIDRINVKKGVPQVYGTQVNVFNGKSEAYPIMDRSRLNERRAEMGLGVWEEYLEEWNPDSD